MKTEEQLKWEEELLSKRTTEQEINDDFDFNEDGIKEKCECGRFINSHGHCPRCDY